MLMMYLCITSASLILLEFLSWGISKTNSLKLLIFIMKIKMRNMIEAFFFPKDNEIFLLPELFCEIQPEQWASCPAELPPAQSSFVPVPPSSSSENWSPPAPLGKHVHSLQVPPWEDGKTCPGLPKNSHDPLPEQSMWLQAGKANLNVLHGAGREGGKGTESHKAALWEFKSVSEPQLLDLQSDRQPLVCGIQLLLWDTECGDTEVWNEIQQERSVNCRRIFSLLYKCNYYCNVIQLKIIQPVLAPNVISP